MQQTILRFLPELSLGLMIAVATHLVMSFAQTLMHYKLGHHRFGGKFFRNHINLHHTYYSKDHLVSGRYLSDEGNNTPFFLIPVFLVGACAYIVLQLDLFVVQVAAGVISFYAHVFFDKDHLEGSRLLRFIRRKQDLHFVHHRHADCNFAVIHFFWDRILGTYRAPNLKTVEYYPREGLSKFWALKSTDFLRGGYGIRTTRSSAPSIETRSVEERSGRGSKTKRRRCRDRAVRADQIRGTCADFQ
jgi:sterol desaturase/sphingolipid hydroxylase (fatty acid hydroxylase superfamily)